MEKKNNFKLPDIYNGKPPRSQHESPDLSNSKIKENYKEAYNQIGYAKDLINDRIGKLQSEKNILEGFRKPILGMNHGMGRGRMPNSYDNFYDMNFLNAARNRMARVPQSNFMRPFQNPYMSNFQQPLYYPLEMPVKGEPLKLPGMELGRPIPKEQKIGGLIGSKTGITAKDLLMIMLAGNGQLNPMIFGNMMGNMGSLSLYPTQNNNPMPNIPNNNSNIPRSMNNPVVNLINPLRNFLPGTNNPNQRKNRWRLVRNFTTLHKYYLIALKYAKNGKPRDAIIDEMTRQVLLDLDSLKTWMMDIQRNFFEELAVFEDLDLNFNKNLSKVELQENYQKICALLNIFIKNMYKSAKDGAIPDRVQDLIYSYVKTNAMFPRKYLTTFEINRLDFYLNGGLKDVTESRAGMIVAYMLISRCFVQTLLLHIKENYPQYKSHPMIYQNGLLLGSLLHYITNSSYTKDPPYIKKIIGLMNYYRNHHLYNKEIEDNQDIVRNIRMGSSDIDELKDNLVPDTELSKFIQDNSVYIERYKGYLISWANGVGKFIRQKRERA